jgi:dienelactone hydrolase
LPDLFDGRTFATIDEGMAYAVPTEYFGPWPDVPVQIHGMDADPIFVDEGDLDAARALVESTEHTELLLYPGDQHYFADSSLPSYDADAAALLTQRVLDFLRSS